jgi:cyclophilin family peptidyl-prolyl cis-trans isomerase
MIQGGGHKEDMSQKPTDPPIANEAYNGLSNVRGTIAMARTSEPHSATSQFFINTVDNLYLDYKDSTSGSRWGYCVFGRVIEGMEVVDAIEGVETETVGSYQNVPKIPVIINDAVEITTALTVPLKQVQNDFITFTHTGSRLTATLHTGEKITLGLYTLAGKEVFQRSEIGPGRTTIPINRLAPGAYIFKVLAGGQPVQKGVCLNY